MSRTTLMVLDQETIDEEALEKKREEAVRMLSLKLRAEGSQTFNQYCGLSEDGTALANGTPISAPLKRVSPVIASQRSPSDGPSPEKRSRASTSQSPSSPVAPLIKLIGRGKGKTALIIDHTKSYVSQVYEIAQAMKWSQATFEHIRTGLPPRELFQVSCRLNGQEYAAPLGTQKLQQGKEFAALEALKSILGDSP